MINLAGLHKVDLLEIAKEVLVVNPDCALSGSLSLQLQKIKIRREPQDVDLYLCFDKKFTIPEGAVFVNDFNQDDYDNEKFTRLTYKYKNCKIEVFQALEVQYAVAINIKKDKEHGIDIVSEEDIISFKLSHAINGRSQTRYKHKDDIIHILINNNI